jgi:hypothetical protein
VSAWIAGLVVLVVRLVCVPVLEAGAGTTAMLHRCCPDHGNAPSSWLRPAAAVHRWSLAAKVRPSWARAASLTPIRRAASAALLATP